MFAGFMPMALPRDRAAKKGLCGLAQVQLHSSPDFHQRVSQLAHHYFIMGGPRREAQALGTARNGGEVDRLYINAIFSEQDVADAFRSEEHTSELQSLMRISYAVFCLKKK